MKSEYLKKFSIFLSFLLLFILTFLIFFTVIISIKPIKLNFLDYFDRESIILKKTEIDEIGDIFITFNKVSKNFELIVEDIVVDDFFSPSILLSLDLSLFSGKFLKTSLKIFDGDFSYRVKKKNEETEYSSFFKKNLKQISLLNNFSEIEIINNKFSFFGSEKQYSFIIDLNYKEDQIFGLVSEYKKPENKISFVVNNQNSPFVNLEANNFKIDFIESFLADSKIQFNDLKISGSSKFSTKDIQDIRNIDFDLSLTGDISYPTYSKNKTFSFKNDNLLGFYSENNFDFSVKFEDKNSKISIGFKKIDQKSLPKIYFGIDEIQVTNLLEIWPNELKRNVFEWMKLNANGKISNVLLKVETEILGMELVAKNISGGFNCEDIEIRYMDSMPKVKKINGNAKITNSSVKFDLSSGHSEKLSIQSGFIDLYDLNTDHEKANINLKIKSPNSNVVDYLNLTTIDKKNYSKLEKIIGNVDLDLTLNFPLLVDLNANEIKYMANAKILKGNFKDIYKNHSIDNLDIEIKINNQLVEFIGKGFLHQSEINFEGEQTNVKNHVSDLIKGKYYFDGSNIQKLFPEFIEKTGGNIEIDFVLKDSQEGLKIEGVGKIDDFFTNSNFLGNDLVFKNGKVRFLIRPYDKKFSGFFDIKTDNINIELNSIFSDSEFISIKVDNFFSPNQNFSLSYNVGKVPKLDILGNKMYIPKINLNDESFLSMMDDFELKIDVENLFIGKNKFNDSQIYYLKKNNEYFDFDFDLIGEKDFHKIKIKEELNKRKFFLESNYVPGLLNVLDIDLAVNTGSLKIEGEKANDSKFYKGKIAGNNFVFLDAPFFADFITLFSLKGLAQKLKDGGIIFESLEGNYEFSKEKLRIIDSLIKGSELGLHFDTVIGLENDFFLTTGTIIPAYTINTLLTKFPIVGDIITAGSPEEGLIGASFKIEKSDDEYDISYNPISVFVPNLIKNFLTD